MKLRHLILLTSAIGASGALLLAADIYRRLKEAEAASVLGGPVREDSVLAFGMYHTMGLLSLAFIFLSLFLMLLTSVREKQFVAAIETPGVAPITHDAMQTAPVHNDAVKPEASAAPAMESAEIAIAPEISPSQAPVPVEVVPEDAAPKPDVVPSASTFPEPAATEIPAPIAEPAPPAPAAPSAPAPPDIETAPPVPEKRVLAFEPPASEIAPPPPAQEAPPPPHSAEPAPPQDSKP